VLRIHNSMTGRKEPFEPFEPGRVRMYVCGITVYDHIHVGHARSQVAFDIARRWLVARGFRVTYVRNITDIDDKILARSRERGEPYDALTARYIASMNEDFTALGLVMPDHEPRATGYMPEIIAMIGKLVDRGFAYVGADGDVFYAVAKFREYGRLSGKRLEDLRAGARVEVDEAKRDPLDFVLWKLAKPGEPCWHSPWGMGRPGWHIECSAMAVALLGGEFDIHGGGMDLKFPHHENEIAQACAACDSGFARLWMHNGFLRIDDEKMSKSLGNFHTVREVLPRLRPEVMRAFLLSAHYRAPLNYTDDNLRQADAALQRLYLALREVEPAAKVEQGDVSREFAEAMDDDFNTPGAIAALQNGARALNVAKAGGERAQARAIAAELRHLGAHLGLLGRAPEEWLATPSALAAGGSAAGGPDEVEIGRQIAARLDARRRREFAEADRIRDELAAVGIILEDAAGGTTWRRK